MGTQAQKWVMDKVRVKIYIDERVGWALQEITGVVANWIQGGDLLDYVCLKFLVDLGLRLIYFVLESQN